MPSEFPDGLIQSDVWATPAEDTKVKRMINSPKSETPMTETTSKPSANKKAIVRAINNNNLEEVKRLLKEYPEEIRRGDFTGTLLDPAVSEKNIDIVEYLLDVGVDVNYPSAPNAIEASICFPNIEIAKLLLSRGADPNLNRPMITVLNCDDKTLRLPFLKLLVEHGADVNQLYDIYGDEDMLFSALDWADEGECHEYLLSVGAKGSEELRKAGRKNGEVYDKSGKRIRDKPVPIIKPTILPATEDQSAIDKVNESIRKVFTEEVINHFTKEIGQPDPKSLIEIVPEGTPITIHSIPATPKRPYVTLFTTGLSAFPMNVPEEMTAREEYEHGELYMQLPADWKYTELKDPQWNWPMLQLRRLAKLPHQADTWLGTPVTIIPNGDPPRPLAANAPFDSLMLVPDKTFTSSLGSVVQLYRVMPLYPEERELEAKKGHAALMRALDKVNAPFIFAPKRANAAK